MKEKLEKDLQQLLAKAVEYGANAAKVVDVPTIKTGAWTRMKCQFGCPNYGKTLCCPPYAPDYEITQKFLNEYKKAVLVEVVCPFPDNIGPKEFEELDKNVSGELLKVLLDLERDAFLMNHYRSFALKAGRCRLCPECNLKKCVNPTKARPSLEACGIDVFALANDNGFPMEVITGPITELKIYGLVLVE